MSYNWLIKKTHKAHFVQISVTFADGLSNCPVVQLLTVNIRKIGRCANTDMQMLSPFIDSSAMLLCYAPDFNQSLLEFIDISTQRPIDSLQHTL